MTNAPALITSSLPVALPRIWPAWGSGRSLAVGALVLAAHAALFHWLAAERTAAASAPAAPPAVLAARFLLLPTPSAPAPAVTPPPAPAVVPPPAAKPVEKPVSKPAERRAATVPAPAAPAPAVATPSAPPSAATEPSTPAAPVLAPPRFNAAYLRNPPPVYPAAARRLQETGTTRLRVLVSAEGLPLQVELETSSGSARLDEAAANTVRRWRFEPAREGTTPVSAWVVVPINWKLEA